MAQVRGKPLFSFGLIADVQYADMDDTFVEGRRQRFREVRLSSCFGSLKGVPAAGVCMMLSIENLKVSVIYVS
jgi:hypothetical protein